MTPEAAAELIRGHLAAPRDQIHARTTGHLNGKFLESMNLLGYLRDFVAADGVELTDAHGKRYLDFLAGYGSIPLGHNHPGVAAAVKAAIDAGVPHFILMAPEALPAALATKLAELCPGDLSMVFLMSSGSEAVDGAMKLARAVTRRPRFVAARRGYHGATFGAMAVTGNPRLEVFEPLGERALVPWGDAAAIEHQLRKRDVAAVILEPIQAEGGINLPPVGYLGDVERLCKKYGALFVLDEVQTGLGRTGTMLACERDRVTPDVIVLAKGLSGGLVPISAYVTRPDLWRKAYGTIATCELHCTTYRGGPLACAAALATIEAIQSGGLVARAERLGQHLGERLRAVTSDHPLVRDVRGRGLLWGIELNAAKDGLAGALIAQWLVVGLLERGIVTQVTTLAPSVIRVEPSLVIEEAQLDRFADAVGDVLATHATGAVSSLFGVGKRLLQQRIDAILGAHAVTVADRVDFLRRGGRLLYGFVARRPVHAIVQVSNRCNLTCGFCSFWENPARKSDELTTDDFATISGKLAEAGSLVVSIEGGEPLMRPDIVDIVAAFARHHHPIMFTNGWKVTPAIARRLWDAGLDTIGVSIDYPDADRHDAHRGKPGTLDAARRAIDVMRDTAPHGARQVFVMTVLMHDNAGSIDRLLELSGSHGVGHQVTLISTGGAGRHTRAQYLPPHGTGARLVELKHQHPQLMSFTGYLEGIDAYLAHQDGGPAIRTPCWAGERFLNIDHLGDVSPCIEKLHLRAGNLVREPWAVVSARLGALTEPKQCTDCWTSCRGFVEEMSGPPRLRSWREFFSDFSKLEVRP